MFDLTNIDVYRAKKENEVRTRAQAMNQKVQRVQQRKVAIEENFKQVCYSSSIGRCAPDCFPCCPPIVSPFVAITFSSLFARGMHTTLEVSTHAAPSCLRQRTAAKHSEKMNIATANRKEQIATKKMVASSSSDIKSPLRSSNNAV